MPETSQFDKIPDEIVHKILCYAMIRDTPFNVDDCLQQAKMLKKSAELKHEGDSSQAMEDDKYFEMSIGAFNSSDLSRSYFQEKDERQSKRLNHDGKQSSWLLHDSSIAIQQPHLSDWRVAGSICRRLRSLGKEAFFSNKVFAMCVKTAKGFQDQSLPGLSAMDQQAASKYINSIILVEYNLRSPSSFISLPHRLPAFPALRRLDFFFGGREGEPLAWMNTAARNGMLPPDHFLDTLKTLGIPTERFDIALLISPDSKWSFHETQLKENVYPTLRAFTTMKARKEPQITDA